MKTNLPVQLASLRRRKMTRSLAAAGLGLALVAAQAPPPDSSGESITVGAILPEKAARDLANVRLDKTSGTPHR